MVYEVALVGFINPRSLMDQLPSKSLARQMTLRMTHKLLGRPKYLNDRPEGRSNLRPEGLAKEEQRSLPTLACLSDQKVWPKRNNARFRLHPASSTERPGQTPPLTPTHVSDQGCTEPLLTALL